MWLTLINNLTPNREIKKIWAGIYNKKPFAICFNFKVSVCLCIAKKLANG